jgi:hypothetical protein
MKETAIGRSWRGWEAKFYTLAPLKQPTDATTLTASFGTLIPGGSTRRTFIPIIHANGAPVGPSAPFTINHASALPVG